jgi:DNA-binding CsgD family transcriptional regulator
VNRSHPAKNRRRSSPAKQRRPQQLITAEPELRQSGLPLLGSMSWGTHFCLFYETKDDLIDAAVPFLKAGLESKEYCLCVVPEPLTTGQASIALRRTVPSLDGFLADRSLEIVPSREWLLKGSRFDSKRVVNDFHDKLRNALDRGYAGMRVTGQPFWAEPKSWRGLYAFECEFEAAIAGTSMTALCTYPVTRMRAADVLDAARTHQCTIARRHGQWEFLETPQLKMAKEEIKRLNRAIDILSGTLGHKTLTSRERMTLAQIVKGASSKEAARALGISPRTVEFHRRNAMQKLGVKNTADLVRRVLGEQ